MRRPLDSYRITGDTKEHAARGVGPATDYAAPRGALPIGTPVRAPFAIRRIVRSGRNSDPGGYTITAYSVDGRRAFIGQHLSAYRDVGAAAQGGTIAYSGNSGSQTSGPHLHCYVIVDGVRMSMEEAMWQYAGEVVAAGGQRPVSELPTPEPTDPLKRKNRSMIHAAWRDENGTIAVQARPGGQITPLENPADWRGMIAASGAEAAQVSNAQMTALYAQYGVSKYPNFDNGGSASLPIIVYVRDGNGTVYLYDDGDLTPLVDRTTLIALHAQHAQAITLSQAEVDNLLKAG